MVAGARKGVIMNGTNNENKTPEKHKEAFEKSVQARALEIELFWKRSIFFWGFIASSFVGYAALRSRGTDLSIVVACFGMVCSVAWSLVNRGSKYWQENWETKVNNNEDDVTGSLFKVQEGVRSKGVWLSARKYSVSKLTIALSDFTSFLWVSIVLYHVWLLWGASKDIYGLLPWAKGLFIIASFVFVGLMFWKGKSSPPKGKKEGANGYDNY